VGKSSSSLANRFMVTKLDATSVCRLNRLVASAVMLVCVMALLGTGVGNQVASAARAEQLTTSIMTFTNFSTSLSPLVQVFNGPFTVLSTTGTNLPCELWALNFNATTGQYLSGTLNSDVSVGFYVVPQASYQDWVKTGTCGNLGDAITGQLLTTSYGVDPPVAIPSSGTWTIVIVNSSSARDAEGYLAIYLTTMPYTVTQPLTGTVTMTTSTTSTTSTVLSSQPVSGFPTSSILLGIVVGLLAIMMLKRRKKVSNSS